MKRIRNKKGFQAIEYTISFTMLIMMVAFFVDIVNINTKRIKITSMSQEIVEIVSQQGGIQPIAPSNFGGGETAYQNSAEITSLVLNQLDLLELQSLTISINGQTLNAGTVIQIPYKSPFSITINYGYNWRFIPNLLGGTTTSSHRHTSYGVSEYKSNYEEWAGER